MFFETLFIQDGKSFTAFNLFKRRLTNIKRSCPTCRLLSSIEFSSIFLKDTPLTTSWLIAVYNLPMKYCCISFESIWHLIIRSPFTLLPAKECACSLSSLLHLLLIIAVLLNHFNLFCLKISLISLFHCNHLSLSQYSSSEWPLLLIISQCLIFLAFLAHKLIEIYIFSQCWIDAVKFSHVLLKWDLIFNHFFNRFNLL